MIASPTALKSVSLQSNRQHEYDVHEISQFHVHIEIHSGERDSNHISLYLVFIFSQCYAKVLDYQVVRLLSRRTIDTLPTRAPYYDLVHDHVYAFPFTHTTLRSRDITQ